MHQPKVGIGTNILLVSYVGSYLSFSIPHPPKMQPMLSLTCSCSIQMNDTTCKGNKNRNKGNDICFVQMNKTIKGNNNHMKGIEVVMLGQTNVVLIAL
jgi:hypothetical protein